MSTYQVTSRYSEDTEMDTSAHVPQVSQGDHPAGFALNYYHADCPNCGAVNGEYCTLGNDTYVSGVGYVAHPARIAAARNAGQCPECEPASCDHPECCKPQR